MRIYTGIEEFEKEASKLVFTSFDTFHQIPAMK